MAQKQYGWIPKDTSQTGYGQDKPLSGVRHAEDRKESFVKSMVSKIMKHRKKKKKKKGYGSVTQELQKNVNKRQKALKDAMSE